jgi:hypothetical protein
MMKPLLRTVFSTIVAVILAGPALYAGGSSYSRYGIGDILYGNGGRSYAFGGASIALIGEGFINTLNPAGLSELHFTRFSGDFAVTHFHSRSDEGTSNFGTGGFNGAAFAIPIDTSSGVVLSLEATPYSAVHYGISTVDSTSLLSSNQTYKGSGGISQLGIGLSASVTDRLHLGAKLQYYFGTLHQYAVAEFADPGYTTSTFDRTVHYSGFGFTGGAILERIGDLFDSRAFAPLTVGLIVQSGWRADLSEEEIVATTDTNYRRTGTAQLPFSYGIGFSYLAAERYLFVGDIYAQHWSAATVDGVHPEVLRNSLRLALGFEALPERTGDTYWKRTAYRAGAYYQSSNVALNGQGIDEYGITAGLGLPLGSEARINLGFQLGSRGTTSNGLQKDLIFRMTVGVTASEVWFMKFAED